MKKIFALLLMINASIFCTAQTVTINSVFKSNAEWTYQYNYISIFCSGCKTEVWGGWSFILMQDTVVNNVSYKKVYQRCKGQYGYNYQYSNQVFTFKTGKGPLSFLGLIRTTGDSVFFINMASNVSQIFLDEYSIGIEQYLQTFDSAVWNSGGAQELLSIIPSLPSSSVYFTCYDNKAGISYKDTSNPFNMYRSLVLSCIDMDSYLAIPDSASAASPFEVYPNPLTNDVLNLVFTNPQNILEARLFSELGAVKKVIQAPVEPRETLFLDLPTGVYFIEVVFKDGSVWTKKLLRN